MNEDYLGFTFGKEGKKNIGIDGYEHLWLERETRIFNVNTQEFEGFKGFNVHDDQAYAKHCASFGQKALNKEEYDQSFIYEVCDTGDLFPMNSQQVLVKNIKGNLYRYFDLTKGQFAKTVGICTNYTFVYDHQQDGSYVFYYAYSPIKYSDSGGIYSMSLSNLVEESIGLTVSQTDVKTLDGHSDYFQILDEEKNKIIFYQKNDKGFRIPYLLDLQTPAIVFS